MLLVLLPLGIVLLLFFLIQWSGIFGTQDVSDVQMPGRLRLTLSPESGGARARVTIHFVPEEAFRNAALSLFPPYHSEPEADSVLLWRGSGGEDFQHRITREIALPQGKERSISAGIWYDLAWGAYVGMKETIYFIALPETLLWTQIAPSTLRDMRVKYELQRRGYENLTPEQIEARDPVFARELRKLTSRRKGFIFGRGEDAVRVVAGEEVDSVFIRGKVYVVPAEAATDTLIDRVLQRDR